jgi:hypothetical protein
MLGRRTQVAKGEVCKTSMQRFKSARRLQALLTVYASCRNPTLASRKLRM